MLVRMQHPLPVHAWSEAHLFDGAMDQAQLLLVRLCIRQVACDQPVGPGQKAVHALHPRSIPGLHSTTHDEPHWQDGGAAGLQWWHIRCPCEGQSKTMVYQGLGIHHINTHVNHC